MGGKRCTAGEFEKRVFTIQGWIVDGVQDYLIKKQILGWGLTTRQADRYIGEAYRRWKSDTEIDINQRRDARIAELKQDIRNMEDKFKNTPIGLRTMLAYKKELSKLEDLYPARRVMVSGDPDNPLEVNQTSQVTIFQIPDNNR